MFWTTFFLTIAGIGLLLAIIAVILLLQLFARPAKKEQVLAAQSQREKELHLENIQLRRRIGWLERRQPPVPLAPFAPDAPTEQQPMAAAMSRHE